jgi:short-subunit dehydrogenase
MDQSYFRDKVAIVTGASSGIGRLTALRLAELGAHVTLAARNLQALEMVAREIEATGPEALIVQTDVGQLDQVEKMVQETLSRWGRLEILVSNAGQYVRSPIKDMDIRLIEQSMAVNFYGGVYAIQAALPTMLEQKSGHIVLVTSMDAKTCLPPDAPYVAAKCAISGYGEVLRQELFRTGVHVSIVYPGRVDTPFIDNLKVPWISTKIPPTKVADAILTAIQKNISEVILPPQLWLLYSLRILSPALMDWAVRFFHLPGWEA